MKTYCKTWVSSRNFFVSHLWGALLVVLMSDTVKEKFAMVPDDKKHVVVPEVVPMMSKITEHELNGLNYLE